MAKVMTWRENYTTTRANVLGEDPNGDLWVPSRTKAEWWDRRFNPRNPTHWLYWLRSRLGGGVAFLEEM